MDAYGSAALPAGVRARTIEGVNGLAVHVLEAGYEPRNRPCVLLLHGFPELAYSWRKVLLPLAGAGFHVVAPDQRGYGRTTGWDGAYDGDLASFHVLNIVRDAVALVAALGHREAAAVIGHDFGSPVAAYCGLIRPDVFRSVALMSAPFAGPPPMPFKPAGLSSSALHDALAALARPRKHYQRYYTTRAANGDMQHAPQGVHAFLRAYYHHKSADWKGNRPYPLAGWTAGELAKLPTYYVMEHAETMPQTVAREMPSPGEIAACKWLTEDELRVYGTEFARTGFQGGLQWYRCAIDPGFIAELQLFSGRTLDVPACFIAGKSDWGIYQKPGELEKMQSSACTRMLGCHLVDGAGHWVQQEQPEAVSGLLVDFLRSVA